MSIHVWAAGISLEWAAPHALDGIYNDKIRRSAEHHVCIQELKLRFIASVPSAPAFSAAKHQNHDELRRILDIVGQTVKVHAR